MAFRLDSVVPWGRSFEEYASMFSLSDPDLQKRILGCGDGPADFNRVLTLRGGHVVSADPLYMFRPEEIRKRIRETYDTVMEQTGKNADEFVWGHIRSLEELGRVRMRAMNEFLSDYEAGLKDGRYVCAMLPHLPFRDGAFDIALCSHYLFLYSEHLSEEFHLRSIRELCRIAAEARIFPLLELGAKKSRHVAGVLEKLGRDGFAVSVITVPYEFQKGGNEMLKIRRASA